MMRTYLLAALVIAGCGSEGPAQLEVQMLSVSGELEGRTLDGNAYTSATGERVGDQGTFFVDGPNGSMQLAACPLGDLEVDPYGQGGSVDGEPARPIVDDAGVPAPGAIGSIDCQGRGIWICDDESCGGFLAEAVSVEIVEANGWRRVVFDASSTSGDARVELLYREAR